MPSRVPALFAFLLIPAIALLVAQTSVIHAPAGPRLRLHRFRR